MQDFHESRINFNFVIAKRKPMTTINDTVKAHAIKHYTYFHEHPELSFKEYGTSAYVQEVLKQEDICFETVGETGVIGLIKGKNTNQTIALRADMDALPVSEPETHAIHSLIPGVMHACGHDLHTACLLGAVQHLNAIKKHLPVNVLFIFQPAEEVLPGGAISMIGSTLFKKFKPGWIIALHSEPELPTGTAGLHQGQYMASGDEIYITLRGPGGHAALPQKSTDIVLVASHLVIALQQISSRHAPPLIPTVLTFGNIRCNSTMNIIPGEITLEGTFRTFDETWRSEAKALIRKISHAIAEGMGAGCEVNIIDGYPSLYNDPEKTEYAIHTLKGLLGNDQVVMLDKRMTTEDFARYSQIVPATFIRLGVNGKKEECGKLHTPEFCPDLNAISYGIEILCRLATQPAHI